MTTYILENNNMLETQLKFKSALKTRQQGDGGYLDSLSFLLLLVTAFICMPSSFAQEKFSVSAKDSQVTFAGEHVGMQFSGIFDKWDADILLPPAASPKIIATFDVTSAKTGDSTYDSTLPEGDWFDVENHPKSVFESNQIVAKDKDYAVTGTLTLRGISQPVSFLLKNNDTTLTASFIIDRLAYSIGMESDPDAEWVNKEIKMTLTLQKQ
ncbi:MAG: polyisoprenoid-binding protein YceI [Bermanella sp.]|jgi:polyisoprenoid-binding protein YceI